jgi:hypothetical protein
VSSAVTMSVPFCIGKIIDIIYTASKDPENTMKLLSNICKFLFGVFLVGGLANFGRVYLIQMAGTVYKVYVYPGRWDGDIPPPWYILPYSKEICLAYFKASVT